MATKKKELPIAEVITGIIMVIIILTFGLPRYFNWLQESKINIATSRILEDLHVARDTSGKNNHNVVVVFHPAASSYTIHEDTNGNNIYDSGEPQRKVVLENGVQFGTNSNLNVTDIWGQGLLGENPVALVGGGNQIIFSPQGQASQSGAIYLVPVEESGINNNNLRAIQIIRTTGSIKVLNHTTSASPPWE